MFIPTTKLRKTSFILTISGIFVASNIYTLIPIYQDVAHSLEVNADQVVTAGSLFTFFYAFGLLCYGLLSGQLGKRNIIVFGMLASALTSLAVGLATDITSLYVFRSLQGLTLGSFAPMAFAFTYDLYPERQRILLLAFINTGFLAAGIIGQIISSLLAASLNWRFVFYFFAFSYIALFISAFYILPNPRLPKVDQRFTLSPMFLIVKNKSFLMCYSITVTLLFSFVAFYDTLSRSFHGSNEELLLIRAVSLAGAALSLFTGMLIKRFGVIKTLNTGLLIGIFSLSGMLFSNHFLLLTLLAVLFVGSITLLIPTIITLIGSFATASRAMALSLYSFFLLVGASLSPLVSMLLPFYQVLSLIIILFISNMMIGRFLSIKIEGNS